MTGPDLRRMREDARLTQMDLASRVKVDVRTIRRWEDSADALHPIVDIALRATIVLGMYVKGGEGHRRKKRR